MNDHITIFCGDDPTHTGFQIPKPLADHLGIGDGDRIAHDWYMQVIAALSGYNLGLSVQFRRSLAATVI